MSLKPAVITQNDDTTPSYEPVEKTIFLTTSPQGDMPTIANGKCHRRIRIPRDVIEREGISRVHSA
jgi:hypothetical protein